MYGHQMYILPVGKNIQNQQVAAIRAKQVAVVQLNQKHHQLKQFQISYNQQVHMTHIRRAIKSSLKEKSMRV